METHSDNDETILQSSHREFVESREEQWQRRDEQAVEAIPCAEVQPE